MEWLTLGGNLATTVIPATEEAFGPTRPPSRLQPQPRDYRPGQHAPSAASGSTSSSLSGDSFSIIGSNPQDHSRSGSHGSRQASTLSESKEPLPQASVIASIVPQQESATAIRRIEETASRARTRDIEGIRSNRNLWLPVNPEKFPTWKENFSAIIQGNS